MDYPSAISYIEEKNKLGITPGLDNIKELLNRLGIPRIPANVFTLEELTVRALFLRFYRTFLWRQV